MGKVAETVNKKPFSLTDRKRSSDCTGGVMVEGVRAADEWVQEAVVSDIFHHLARQKKKKKPTAKRKGQPCRTTRVFTEPLSGRLWR